MCPKPSDEIIAKVKGDKAAKAAGKKVAAATLTDDLTSTAAVTTFYIPPTTAMSKWTKKQNIAWLHSRGLSTTGKAPELKARVKEYTLLPIVCNGTTVASVDDSITVTGLASVETATHAGAESESVSEPTSDPLSEPASLLVSTPALFQSVYGVQKLSKEDAVMNEESNV